MAQLKDLIPQIPKDELAILRDLNSKLDESNLTEATAKEAAQAVKEIIQNWKTWSKYTVAAMLLIPNIANALETYSPETLNVIKTEISGEKPGKTKGNPRAAKTEDFSKTFASGQFEITDKKIILDKVNNIKKWISKNKTKPFKLVIVASESQVPNPKEFGKGELAQARGEALKVYLDNLGATDIEIKTLRGKVPWDPKKGEDHPDYTKDQFVKVQIIIDTESICNLDKKSKEGEQGNSSNDFRTYDEYLSGNGNITLHTGTIPDRMIILDENDRITYDTGYVATDKTNAASGYEEWYYVPIYVAKLTQLKANKTVMGSNIETKRFNTFEELVKYMLKPGARQGKSDTVDKALDELELMFNKGIKEFVFYKVGTNDLKIEFMNDKGDSKVQIFSPVGKTGFDLTGQCVRK
jgi:hypothetical protein